MSMFQTQTVHCPACGTAVEADLFYSVNADRRPDLRAGALDGSLQLLTCLQCATAFRVDPEFNYLDMQRGQWIAVHALDRLGTWEVVETADQASFDKAYGPAASAGARSIGEALKVRIVFGWAAFREKLVAAESGLDDCELELLKMAILRTRDHAPLSQTVELRLIEQAPEGLILSWLEAATEKPVETLLVPTRAYQEIAESSEEWAPLRADLSQGPFVDMQRLMI